MIITITVFYLVLKLVHGGEERIFRKKFELIGGVYVKQITVILSLRE